MVKDKKTLIKKEKILSPTDEIIKYISVIGIILGGISLLEILVGTVLMISDLTIFFTVKDIWSVATMLFSEMTFFYLMFTFLSYYLYKKNNIARKAFLILALFWLIPMLPSIYSLFTEGFFQEGILMGILYIITVVTMIFLIISGYYLLFNKKVKEEFK